MKGEIIANAFNAARKKQSVLGRPSQGGRVSAVEYITCFGRAAIHKLIQRAVS
jgi:hypothetical protein